MNHALPFETSCRPGWELLPFPAGAKVGHFASVDVEDYYHAAALGPAAPRRTWATLESRVAGSTLRTLALFRETRSSGTFFTLGCVAAAEPALIRKIVAEGHELASHGFDHFRVREQTPAEFFADVDAAKKTLEDISGQEVIGYRAPNFSIDRGTWWAYDALARAGYRYSSSVYPVRHDHYGMPDAPHDPFRTEAGLIEFPITTVSLLGRALPAGGGGYFRLLPYGYSRWATRRAAAVPSRRAINYFHPWEIDPGQPRFRLPPLSRFRHYVNLGRMEGKLRRLLSEFEWTRMDAGYHILAGSGTAPSA